MLQKKFLGIKQTLFNPKESNFLKISSKNKIKAFWAHCASEAKDRNSWRKRNGCIILNGYTQQKKKIYQD